MHTTHTKCLDELAKVQFFCVVIFFSKSKCGLGKSITFQSVAIVSSDISEEIDVRKENEGITIWFLQGEANIAITHATNETEHETKGNK